MTYATVNHRSNRASTWIEKRFMSLESTKKQYMDLVGQKHWGMKRFKMLDDLMGGGTYEEIKRLAEHR